MEGVNQQMQQQIMQFQSLQQQFQAISSQRLQMEMQLKEAERAAEEIKKLRKGDDIYRSIGTILVKKGKTIIGKELEEEKETLEIRLKAMKKQEGAVKDKLTKLQKEIQGGMESAGGPKAG